jgi:hypothetical protein
MLKRKGFETGKSHGGIQTVPRVKRDEIARLWLQRFAEDRIILPGRI